MQDTVYHRYYTAIHMTNPCIRKVIQLYQ